MSARSRHDAPICDCHGIQRRLPGHVQEEESREEEKRRNNEDQVQRPQVILVGDGNEDLYCNGNAYEQHKEGCDDLEHVALRVACLPATLHILGVQTRELAP